MVDFVVRGIDDMGRPSQSLLEVTEVALVDERGTVLGRFRDADTLGRYLARRPVKGKLVAVETAGLPRPDLTGRYCCYEQAVWDSLPERLG